MAEAAFSRVVREGFLEAVIFGQRPNDEKEPALGKVEVRKGGTRSTVVFR